MFKTLKNKKGVTLVELLAVIVILGIIAAIAVPTIGGLIERQRENAAEAEFDNAMEAARLYFVDESVSSVTAAVLVSEGYLSANPFDDEVTFTDGTPITIVATDGTININGYTLDASGNVTA